LHPYSKVSLEHFQSLEQIEELEIQGKFGGNTIARVTMDNLKKLSVINIEENS
jgi:hypothetical protein